jgi:hypothetical protein
MVELLLASHSAGMDRIGAFKLQAKVFLSILVPVLAMSLPLGVVYLVGGVAVDASWPYVVDLWMNYPW